MDENLITQADYDAVKESVLRAQGSILQAQQIKAGLDAGIIPEEELANVKRAFLNSLSIQSGNPSTPAAPGSTPGALFPNQQQQQSEAHQGTAHVCLDDMSMCCVQRTALGRRSQPHSPGHRHRPNGGSLLSWLAVCLATVRPTSSSLPFLPTMARLWPLSKLPLACPANLQLYPRSRAVQPWSGWDAHQCHGTSPTWVEGDQSKARL